ncbi:MAG: hypothetical protein JW717_08800 [Marinilabiliaceae bacterium]|nr:hypothetical protein [Marinilabiliaceae bacterium]
MKKCNNGKYGFGIVLILAGLLLLASNLNWIPVTIEQVLLSWPMILVAIGLISLFNKEFTVAIIFLGVGAYFILPRIYPGFSFVEIWKFWPIILIFFGLGIVFRRKRFEPKIVKEVTNEDLLDEVAIFGGRVTKIESKDFKGGRVTCVFGGCELHLENAEMSVEGAILDISAIFGGLKLVVPRDWNVKVEVVSIFGGFSDKRLFATDLNNKTLVIKGSCVFGGGELSNI